MADRLQTTNTEKFNVGMKSIVSELEDMCNKVKLLKGNEGLYNEIQCIIQSLSTQGEKNDYATGILNLEKSLQEEQSWYMDKTGISISTLPENSELTTAIKILQETGIHNYNSSSLFTHYMSIVEKFNKNKEIIDGIDEQISKLKIVIDQQNDLKSELCGVTYTPVGYIAKPIDINPINNFHKIDDCEKIMDLVRKIHDIEIKQEDICNKVSNLKSEQLKMYHGLPPNLEQATIAVNTIENKKKTISKQLMDQLGKK